MEQPNPTLPKYRPRPKRVRPELTPGMARMINSALALLEADEHEPGFDWRLLKRTRAEVHLAMELAKVEP